jgi:hypothetical protein
MPELTVDFISPVRIYEFGYRFLINDSRDETWIQIQRTTWCMGPYAGVDFNLTSPTYLPRAKKVVAPSIKPREIDVMCFASIQKITSHQRCFGIFMFWCDQMATIFSFYRCLSFFDRFDDVWKRICIENSPPENYWKKSAKHESGDVFKQNLNSPKPSMI